MARNNQPTPTRVGRRTRVSGAEIWLVVLVVAFAGFVAVAVSAAAQDRSCQNGFSWSSEGQALIAPDCSLVPIEPFHNRTLELSASDRFDYYIDVPSDFDEDGLVSWVGGICDVFQAGQAHILLMPPTEWSRDRRAFFNCVPGE